ncbi:MAG: sensor histidine kinase [Terriglobia bacterium]
MVKSRQSSITAKLTRMNTLVSAAALLLACAAFTAYTWLTVRAAMVERLSAEAQIVAFNSTSALLFNDPVSAQKTLEALRASPSVVDAEIYTAKGELFAGYWRGQKTQPAALLKIGGDQAEDYLFRRGALVLVRRIDVEGKRAGVVMIRSDLKELTRRLEGYAAIVAVVLVACLGVVVLISAGVRRSISEPVIRLAKTARIVSRDKNYSLRTAATGSHDELDFLIEAFNEMLAQIQQRDASLQKAHDELERRVEKRTRQLHAVNKELEAFSYSVSHDLRAPLRQISGFSKILIEENEAQLNSDGRHYAARIEEGARNMGRLVDDLLGMGRISRQEVVRKPEDLNQLLQEVLERLQPELEGRKIDWRIGALPALECDAGLIKLVFTNLLSNAVKFTRRRECAVIETGQMTLDGEDAIFVRDNGAGFDQKYAHKLFGVFQRLHRVEDFEGTGVGLATVQRIIHKHGGRIWAEGEVERGATFFFTLVPGKASRSLADNPLNS